MKVCLKSEKALWIYCAHKGVTDGSTDGRKDEQSKNIMPPPPKVGRGIISYDASIVEFSILYPELKEF